MESGSGGEGARCGDTELKKRYVYNSQIIEALAVFRVRCGCCGFVTGNSG